MTLRICDIDNLIRDHLLRKASAADLANLVKEYYSQNDIPRVVLTVIIERLVELEARVTYLESQISQRCDECGIEEHRHPVQECETFVPWTPERS